MGSFRIKVDFSEVTDSFWKEAWHYVKDTEKIKDFWDRCRQDLIEDVSDTDGIGHSFGLFLNDRYLFPSLPTTVLKEDDTVCVRLLSGSRPLGVQNLLRLNAEAMFHGGPIAHVSVSRFDANIVTETSENRKQVLKEPKVLDMSFLDPTTVLATDSCALPTKKRRKRNVCDTLEDNNGFSVSPAVNMVLDTVMEGAPKKSKKKTKKITEDIESAELPSVETKSSIVNADSLPEDKSTTETPDKRKKKKGSIGVNDTNTTDNVLIDFSTQDSTCNMEEGAEPEETNVEQPSFSEAEQFPVREKRRRTRRRKPKVVEVAPEPVSQVGSFKGDLFYKPPLSKRLYSLESKSNTKIRFDEDGDGKNDLESSNQAAAQENERFNSPLSFASPSTDCHPSSSYQLTLRSSTKVKTQASDPGLANLLSLTQSPIVFNRNAVTPSTPIENELEPLNQDLPVQQDYSQLPVATQKLCTVNCSKTSVTVPDPGLGNLFALTRSPVIFRRSSSAVSTSSASQLEPVKEEFPINQGVLPEPTTSRSLRDASFSKNPPKASDWDIQNYEQYPLISEPRVNEVIAFKELELSSSYEPVMSNYKVAQIVKICPLTKKIVLEILSGETKIVRSGKFEIEDEDAECVDLEEEETKNQRECCWKDLKETRLIYP